MVAPALSAAALTIGLIIGSALLYASHNKLRDAEATRLAVLDYQLMPPALGLSAGLLLGGVELILGAALALGNALAGSLTILLVALLSVIGLVTLARGLEIDCHCGGEGERLSFRTLGRNAALLLLLAVALVIDPRHELELTLLEAPLPLVLSVALATGSIVALFGTWRLWSNSLTRASTYE